MKFVDLIKESSWQKILNHEFEKPYMQQLESFVLNEYNSHKNIYPSHKNIFTALNLTNFNRVKVVIVGQDPYHGPNQAHGLSFSVREGVPFPPSLRNILKELSSCLNLPLPKKGDLSAWAKEGVLLLNAILTVEEGKPGSHQNKGWEKFTDFIIQQLSERKTGVAFVLWGAYAQKKGERIDVSKHLVITAPHPSPLSCHKGFFGSAPFTKVNRYLEDQGSEPINWSLD